MGAKIKHVCNSHAPNSIFKTKYLSLYAIIQKTNVCPRNEFQVRQEFNQTSSLSLVRSTLQIITIT